MNIPEIERMRAALEDFINAKTLAERRALTNELEESLSCEALTTVLAHIDAQQAEIERLKALLVAIDPYLDALICYASTQGEYEPNRIIAQIRAAMKGSTP